LLYTFGAHEAQGTTGSLSNSPATVLRAMCFRLLAEIPDEALIELYETMEELLEFYTTRRPAPQPGPVIRETPAIMGQQIVSPGFRIDEE
jgi:hypothetical protein